MLLGWNARGFESTVRILWIPLSTMPSALEEEHIEAIHRRIDKERMTQYLNLTFASSMDVVLQHFPKENGKQSLGLFKELVSDFVICGRTTSGDILIFHAQA